MFAAPIFDGSWLNVSIGVLTTASGVLALAGLGGVAAGDMRLQNIGRAGRGAGPLLTSRPAEITRPAQAWL